MPVSLLPSPPPVQPPMRSQPATAPPAPPAPAERDKEAVRNAFAAKVSQEPESRRGLWLALGACAIAGAGIAGYFWYQLSTLNGGSLAGNPSPTAAQRPSPPVPPPPAPLPVPVTRLEAPPESPPAVFAGAPRPQVEPHAPPPSAPSPSPPIQLKRTPPAVDPHVDSGYAALQASALEAARKEYEQALRNDPRNIDALLALAAIAQRQGRAADAEGYRQRAYEVDPKDAAAQAAVIAQASGDPVALESRLKSLLAAQPESAPLNFALGNLYARQNRWAEAQPAYFNAVAAEGDNPDYLFNLAVSLDHLRQPRLAAQHYRLALEAAERRPAAFDRDRARKRLQDIQP